MDTANSNVHEYEDSEIWLDKLGVHGKYNQDCEHWVILNEQILV